jgi:hypothetical protein
MSDDGQKRMQRVLLLVCEEAAWRHANSAASGFGKARISHDSAATGFDRVQI